MYKEKEIVKLYYTTSEVAEILSKNYAYTMPSTIRYYSNYYNIVRKPGVGQDRKFTKEDIEVLDYALNLTRNEGIKLPETKLKVTLYKKSKDNPTTRYRMKSYYAELKESKNPWPIIPQLLEDFKVGKVEAHDVTLFLRNCVL